MEHRYSREHFTRVLTKICEGLDIQSTLSLTCKKHRYSEITDTFDVSVTKLWVAGSYARGALDCGDLDLIVEINAKRDGKPAVIPSQRKLGKQLFKSPSDVRFYWGTPEESTAGIVFEEAVLIWQAEIVMDWQTAIHNIKPNSQAGHFFRVTDEIPLRMEQLSVHLQQVESLVSLQSNSVLTWHFEPFLLENLSQPHTADEIMFYKAVQRNGGQKTQKLIPHLFYLLGQKKISEWERWEYPLQKTQFRHGGSDVFVGQPTVPVWQLDSLSTFEVVVVPHISKRGPNGAWIIRRGDNHPTCKELEACHLFFLTDESGRLPVERYENTDTGHEGGILMVFKSEASAQEEIGSYQGGDDKLFFVKKISTHSLLRMLSFSDVLRVDYEEYALTPAGKLVLESDEILSNEEVIKVLIEG